MWAESHPGELDWVGQKRGKANEGVKEATRHKGGVFQLLKLPFH